MVYIEGKRVKEGMNLIDRQSEYLKEGNYFLLTTSYNKVVLT